MAVVAMDQIVACNPTPRFTRISGAMFRRRSRRTGRSSSAVRFIGARSSERAPVLAGLAAKGLEADVAPQVRRQQAKIDLPVLAWLGWASFGEPQGMQQRQQAQ